MHLLTQYMLFYVTYISLLHNKGTMHHVPDTHNNKVQQNIHHIYIYPSCFPFLVASPTFIGYAGSYASDGLFSSCVSSGRFAYFSAGIAWLLPLTWYASLQVLGRPGLQPGCPLAEPVRSPPLWSCAYVLV